MLYAHVLACYTVCMFSLHSDSIQACGELNMVVDLVAVHCLYSNPTPA